MGRWRAYHLLVVSLLKFFNRYSIYINFLTKFKLQVEIVKKKQTSHSIVKTKVNKVSGKINISTEQTTQKA